MKIWLSRWIVGDPETNMSKLRAEVYEAASAGADIVVLPELFLTGYRGTLEAGKARDCFAKLSDGLPETIFLFGTISEEKRNRATMWRGGREILRYDKINLFLPNGEDKLWERGCHYSAVETSSGRMGVNVCNDIRFPEAARALRLEQRIDILLVPAWWPWRRNGTWKALLKARAIENAVFVAGCCVAGADAAGERFSGAGNYLFDPLGTEVLPKDDSLYEIETPFRGPVLVDPLTAGSARFGSKLFKN